MSYPTDPTNVESRHPKIQSMASVGHITKKTCKLWIRVYRAATWWLVVTDKPIRGDLDTLDGMQVDAYLRAIRVKPIYIKQQAIDESTDLTHTFTINGLQPDKRYYYAVIADIAHKEEIPRRTEIGNQQQKFFDSLPQDQSNITFGFYSCHDPFSNEIHGQGAWPDFYQALVDHKAQFAIGGGDQVYVDTNDKKDMYSIWKWLAKYKKEIVKDFTTNGKLQSKELIEYFKKIYRNYYRIYWRFEDLQKVHEQFPQYFIWDDHEIMDGWGSYTRDQRKRLLNWIFQDDDGDINLQLVDLMFEAAKWVYNEYQHSHNPRTEVDLTTTKAANKLCEWDYSFKMGHCAFYVLDQRGHHDYERHPDGNALLGDLQMGRFNEWLNSTATKAKAVFIVSPVPVVHWGPLVSSLDIGPVQDDLRDEWEHESNTKERNKLLDAVFSFSDSNKCPVVFLSGDVHCASVFKLESQTKHKKARVYNATSSAISRKPAPEKAEWFFQKTGELKDYAGGYLSRLYAMAGEYNFFLIKSEYVNGELELDVDLCWPGGSEGELIRKRVPLD